MRKNFLFSICIILLASCHNAKQADSQAGTFTLTDTMMANTRFAKAQYTDVKNELRLYGKIMADNSKSYQVFPIVGGNVIKVNVELGDHVSKGQVLAVIRSGEAADYEKQKADAMNDVTVAEKNLQVAKELAQSKLNTQQDVLAAQAELDKAQSALQRIEQLYAIYDLKQGALYNVTAPISGFIVEKNINPDVVLSSSNLNNLFSIAEINEVWVIANVNESDIRLITEGMPASIKTISYPERIFNGKVDRIFNILDPDTKAMKVRIRIPNSDLSLKPGMSATVAVEYNENRKLIAIPSAAVIFDKSKNWVMIFKDRNHIETRQVDVYRQVGDLTYISSGLQEGETVITQNQMLIYDALND
ncbi:MAG TPA: efflux RND transporter periplasmic adaptor subunit [Chitinophagaceae bacterium]|nr:efflux RND transporter periplasmic adaptor subunit [Chitinophagaceae bacterium]